MMALKNYKVTYEDGSENYFQFEDDDPGLKALKDAADNKANQVKSVAAGNPTPFNK